MIIVSQDETANINYENIETIYLSKKNGKIEINARGKYDYTIGTYATEERAIEILADIYAKIFEGKTTYKMPKE